MRNILMLLTILFSIISCNKSDDTLEPVLPLDITTGKNTIGCYINGMLLTPRDGNGNFNSPVRAYLDPRDPGPVAYTYKKNDPNNIIEISDGRFGINRTTIHQTEYP